MTLTASPFAPTGELLPVYRDAYLRGDLSRQNTAAVDAYLKANNQSADAVWHRLHEMKQEGEQVRPVGWVQRQFDLIRTEPVRLRRRATSLVAGAAFVSGAVFAGVNLPTTPDVLAAAEPAFVGPNATAAGAASSLRMVTVRGRILNENGKPLVGATVLDRSSLRGVSTDAHGEYVLLVPEGRATTLAYGYGGYQDEAIHVKGGRTENVTLVPSGEAPKPAKRWLSFLKRTF